MTFVNEKAECLPRKQIKSEAQDALRDEAIVQFRRIEKLFGYVPGSWSPFP